MAYKDLKHFVQTLEQVGELIRIKEFVSPHLEIAEITDRISKHNGPALLFENTGTEYPVLINAFGSEKRMCLALGVSSLDEIGQRLEDFLQQLTMSKQTLLSKLKFLPKLNQLSRWIPKHIKSVKADYWATMVYIPNLSELPALTCWPADGGPFITLPLVHTTHPVTGKRNVGMYRMQVFNHNETGMHWHLHKGGASHYEAYKKLGKKMPVTVTLGGDPVYTYAATAPLPDGIDEYVFAGFLRKKPVELIKSYFYQAEIPADVDIVMEGYIDPAEENVLEGPFGDHTGYYSLQDYYPKFHVLKMTFRNEAIYPSTIVGIPPQEDAWLGKATERIFLMPLRKTIAPEIIDMVMPVEGVFHNIVLVKIKKTYAGQAVKVMNSLWGAGQMMFNKIMVVIDDNDIDINDYKAVAKAVSENVNPQNDIHIITGPLDVLDHSCDKTAFGSKMGIDATTKYPEEKNKSSQAEQQNIFIDKEKLKINFPEIKEINDSLLKDNISAIFISIEKNKKNHVKQLTQQMIESGYLVNIRFLICLDYNTDVFALKDAIWQLGNNIAPKRDTYISANTMAIDATRKTNKYDGFERDWPNIITADDETIKTVDVKWHKLGLGEFIPSPSLKYKNQLYGNGAVVQE